MVDSIRAHEFEALDRLINIAQSDTGQAGRVANFLLAWWNARDNGGFNLTDLWNVDHAIAKDMITVFGMVATTHSYPDAFGYEAQFRQMVTDWRRPKRARKAGAR